MEGYFKVFACCIPVRGAKRSTICDVQRHTIKLIPNDLYDLIKNHEGKTLAEIKSHYDPEFHEIVEEYIEFMIKNDFGFFTDSPTLYPKMNLDWERPFEINNAIIDVRPDSNHPFGKIIEELNSLGCQSLQIRYFYPLSFEEIIAHVDQHIEHSRLKNLEIFVGYHEEYHTTEKITEFLRKILRVNSLIIHSAPTSEKIDLKLAFAAYSDEKIDSETHCGVVSPSYFLSNISLFSESTNFNSCLNKKISVDSSGLIRNCPSMKQSFGHIRENSLRSALNNDHFRDHWNITKDQIEVCKDCEFRFVCTDCRAYTKDANHAYSKPAKCSYDPYTHTWN